MTGINFNVQNSYAALYTATQAQPNSSPQATNVGSNVDSANTIQGEKLTLSDEAIALLQEAQKNVDAPVFTPASNGFGLRPPADPPPPPPPTPT